MGNQMNIPGKMSRDIWIQTFPLRRKWLGLHCIANYSVNGKTLIAAGFLFLIREQTKWIPSDSRRWNCLQEMSWLFLLLPVVTLSKRQNTNAKQVPDVRMRTQGYTVCVCARQVYQTATFQTVGFVSTVGYKFSGTWRPFLNADTLHKKNAGNPCFLFRIP